MISRKEMMEISNDELSELLTNVLMVVLVRGGEDDHRIPKGFTIECETDKLKIKFDIDANVKLTDAGRKSINSLYGKIVHMFSAGELNE